MDSQQQFCLKWNSFGSNLATAFGNLYKSESLTDVTLFCEGVTFRAHRVILAACSKHFQELFEGASGCGAWGGGGMGGGGGGGCPPGLLVILDGTSSANLAALLQFMYRGEVHVSQDSLSSFLKAAECLQVKGLSIEHERLTVDHGAPSPHQAPQHHQHHHAPLSHHHHIPPHHAHSHPSAPDASPTTRKQPRLVSSSRTGTAPSSPPGSPPYDAELMHAPAAPTTSTAATTPSSAPPYSSVISPFVPQYRPYDRAGNPGSSPAATAPLPPPSSSPSSSSSSSTSSPLVASAHDRKRHRGIAQPVPSAGAPVDHHRPRPLSSPAGDGGTTPPAVPAPAPSPGAEGASPGIRASVLRECKSHGASDDKMPMALVSPHRSTPIGSGEGGSGNQERGSASSGTSFAGTQPRAVSPPFGSAATSSMDQGEVGKSQAADMDGGGNSCPEDLRIKSEPGIAGGGSWLRGVSSMEETTAVKVEGDGGGGVGGGGSGVAGGGSGGGGGRYASAAAQPIHATAGPTSAAVAAAAAALWNSGGTGGGGAKGSHKSGSTATADGKKLKCPYCERLYGYETNLRAHIRQRHQGIRVPCPFCSRTFTRNNTVRRHIAREHKTELSLKAFQQAAAAAAQQQQQQQQVGAASGQQVANHSGGGGSSQ